MPTAPKTSTDKAKIKFLLLEGIHPSAIAVLQEARAMLEQAQAQCQQLLTSRRDQLDAMAQALLRSEVLSGDELKQLLDTAEAPTGRSMIGQKTVTVRQRTESLTDMA